MPQKREAYHLCIKKHIQKPSNWPEHVQFLQSTIYHATVSPMVRQYMRAIPPSGNKISISGSRSPKVVIRRIQNSSHPAFGQFGLFAAQRIPPKCYIIQYIGT